MNLDPLEQLNWITMASMAVIFLASLLVLRKMLFAPLIEVMERRAAKAEKARARYEEMALLREDAEKEARRITEEAAGTAGRLSDEVKAELAKVREARRAKAGAEAEDILLHGREDVARLRRTEQARLKEHLMTFSRQTLAKMISDVNEEALELIVNRVLAGKGAAEQP